MSICVPLILKSCLFPKLLEENCKTASPDVVSIWGPVGKSSVHKTLHAFIYHFTLRQCFTVG